MTATAAVMPASASRVFASPVQNCSNFCCSLTGPASPGVPPVLTMPGSILTWMALSEVSPGPQNPSDVLVRCRPSGTKSKARAAATPPATTATPQMRMISRATGRTVASLTGYALETIGNPGVFPCLCEACSHAGPARISVAPTAADALLLLPPVGPVTHWAPQGVSVPRGIFVSVPGWPGGLVCLPGEGSNSLGHERRR